jgi:dihydroneopterin aldolase
MDRITLRAIVAHGCHGANPGERDRPQPFHLDLAIDLDLARASVSDDLRDTVDYACLHRRIVEIVETQSYVLLERLAAVILGELMADPRIARAELSIAKPALLDGATPSVTLVRTR